MITANINLGENVFIERSSHVNNVIIGNNCKIAGENRIFGSPSNMLLIGEGCYIGPYCMLDGFNSRVSIGDYVSFGQRVTLISGSAPNASKKLQRIFPILTGSIEIGDHSWIGTQSVIMPKVSLGRFCIVAANSFVNKSFPDYSIIGGSPAKLIRMFTDEEIQQLTD
jgi:acetyltransferase-like isoleucine patch superfamily enzyme